MSAQLTPKPAMVAADGIGRPNALHGQPVQGYSRFVIWMKVLLPVVALLLIVLIVVWPYLKLNDTRFNIGFTALKVGNVENPAMINPRFLGADYFGQIGHKKAIGRGANLGPGLAKNRIVRGDGKITAVGHVVVTGNAVTLDLGDDGLARHAH